MACIREVFHKNESKDGVSTTEYPLGVFCIISGSRVMLSQIVWSEFVSVSEKPVVSGNDNHNHVINNISHVIIDALSARIRLVYDGICIHVSVRSFDFAQDILRVSTISYGAIFVSSIRSSVPSNHISVIITGEVVYHVNDSSHERTIVSDGNDVVSVVSWSA